MRKVSQRLREAKLIPVEIVLKFLMYRTWLGYEELLKGNTQM